MKYKTFPKTDLAVSVVGFGVWTITTGWWGDFSDEDGARLLRKAYDLGVTLFDTADTYGNGRGEALLPLALKDVREKVVYATKFGYNFYDHGEKRDGQKEIPQDFSPDFVRYACEQSLKRLQTDYIDLYQIHNARLEQVRDGELFGVLEDLKAEGKIRHFGIALGPAIGWHAEGVAAIREREIPSIQIIYNLLEQYPGNVFARVAGDEGSTGFLVRVPHSSGMLEGKYTEDTVFGPKDHRRHRPRSWLINGLKKIETLEFLTKGGKRTLGQAAIQWILADPTMISTLPNIYNEEQLLEFAAASDTPELTDPDLHQVDELRNKNFGVEEPPMAFKGIDIDSTEAQEILAGAEAT